MGCAITLSVTSPYSGAANFSIILGNAALFALYAKSYLLTTTTEILFLIKVLLFWFSTLKGNYHLINSVNIADFDLHSKLIVSLMAQKIFPINNFQFSETIRYSD